MKAKDAMTSPVITVTPETHRKQAASLMASHRVSALPVLDPDGRLVGIISEADLLTLEARPDPRSQATPLAPRTAPLPTRVDEVMSPEVYTVDETTDLGVVAQRMLETGVKRFPVLRGDRLAGIVSRPDLVKVMATTDEAIETQVRRALADEIMRLSAL